MLCIGPVDLVFSRFPCPLEALANPGVNIQNKERIAKGGGIPPLIGLSRSANPSVAVEAIAALANLAVNDMNEIEIAEQGGLKVPKHQSTKAS